MKREVKRLREYLEGDIDLGDVVFASRRLDVVEDEPDTDEERELLRKIEDYVLDNVPLNLKSVRLLRSLVHDPRYADYFAEPDEGLSVYRGLKNIEPAVLAGWLGIDEGDVPDSGESDYKGVLRGVVGPTQSFSSKLENAKTFTASNIGKYSVVFTARVSDNPGGFIDFSRGIYNTADMNIMVFENEMMSLKPVKVCSIWWKKNS